MDKNRAEIIKRCLDLLGEESYGGEVEESKRSPMGLYEVRAPEGLFDPGYARLRKLGWPACDF